MTQGEEPSLPELLRTMRASPVERLDFARTDTEATLGKNGIPGYSAYYSSEQSG